MVAVLLGTAAAVAVCGAVVLSLIAEPPYGLHLFRSPEPVIGLAFSVVGAVLVAGTRVARPMGWLLLAVGLCAAAYVTSLSISAFVLGFDGNRLLEAPTDGQLSGPIATAVWLTTWTWLPALVLTAVVLPQVVPYGRALTRWWNLLLISSYVVLAAGIVVTALQPGESTAFENVVNPYGIPALAGALTIGGPLIVALQLLALVTLVLRFRSAGGVERRQIGLFGLAVVAVIVAIPLAPWWLLAAVTALIPISIAVAALRYRLYGLDLIVNRALVAAVLLGGAALVYLALVGWVGSLVGSSTGFAPFAAAFLIALAFHPARLRVQRAVDRLLYGERGNPYALLARLDETVRNAAGPRPAIRDMVAELATGLKLPGVAVEVQLRSGDTVRETWGLLDGSDPYRLSLDLHGEQVGTLEAANRPGSTEMSRTDKKALAVLAAPVTAAAFALRLTGDLDRARQRVLVVREEERRRLRRDLHDGLGPQLSSVVMSLDTAVASLDRGEPDRVRTVLAGTTDQVREAVADVRRLVRGLRPPVLDELGLSAAVQALATSLLDPSTRIEVLSDGDLTSLPAAVEAAAYRIAAEAVTNAARHAGASAVRVEMAVSPTALELRIADDGRGLAPSSAPGVGLTSMRERAAELGGTLEVRAADQGGTVCRAHLPLLETSGDDQRAG